MRSTRPTFRVLIDLGLRDVGAANDSRRLARHFATWFATLFAFLLASVVVTCVVARGTGAGRWAITGLGLLWLAGSVALGWRAMNRAPVLVLRVTAEGRNQATWLVLAGLLPLVAAAALMRDAVAIAVVILIVPWAALVARSRRRLPNALRELGAILAADERVLGDGIGRAGGPMTGRAAPRLAVATDRRLLITTWAPAADDFVLVDAPYQEILRFDIAWQRRGRAGSLALTTADPDGAARVTQVGTMAPESLLSIARVLESRGIATDDHALIAEARRAWEAARHRPESRRPLFGRAAATREFDHGLWLLTGVCALIFYLNPLGIGIGASRSGGALFVLVPVTAAVSGYVAATRASLAYLAPLNLLLVPAFFFVDATNVLVVMVAFSLLAAIGLVAGSLVREARRGVRGAPAPGAAVTAASPPGGLRTALSGARLARLSAALVAASLALVAAAGAAGFPLAYVGLAIYEKTATQVPVDGRSNLTGNTARIGYVPEPDLHELITDEHWGGGPDDGARWELRSSYRKGYNVVSLAHYVFSPRLDDPSSIADFVADKDHEHARLAGHRVGHTTRVIGGRTAYVWKHRGRSGNWYFTAWLPQPVHTVRLECVATTQVAKFQRLCGEAVRSLTFSR